MYGFKQVDGLLSVHDFSKNASFFLKKIEMMLRSLPPSVRILSTTATANDRVMADLETIFGPGLAVSRGELGRPSLIFQTIRLP